VCDVSATQPDLTVTWNDPENDPKRVVVGVYEKNVIPAVFSQIFPSVTGINTISVHVGATLNTAKGYEIRLAREDKPLILTGGLPVLFTQPVNLTLSASSSGIMARWTNTGATPVTASRLLLSSGATAAVIVDSFSNAPDWDFVPLPVPLALQPPVRLKVRPLIGVQFPQLPNFFAMTSLGFVITSLGPPSAEVTVVQATHVPSLIDNSGANPRIVRVPRPAGTAGMRTFIVQLLADGVVIQTMTVTEQGTDTDALLQLNFADPISPSKLYELTLQQQDGLSTGPVGPPSPILTAAPVPVSLVRRGPDVAFDVVFRGLPLPGAVSVASGAGAAAIVDGSSGVVTASGADVAFRAALPLAHGVSLGPSVTARVGPSIASATTDPVSGLTTIFWSAVSGATSYLVQIYGSDGLPLGAPITVDTTMLTLDEPLLPNAPAFAAISVVTASGTDPIGQRFALPAAQPSNVRVAFDGRLARVTWTPAGGASGYQVSLLDGSPAPALSVIVANVPETTLDVSSLPPANSYSIVVQALEGGNSGPPSAPLPLFAAGYFIGTPASIRPATTMALEPETITLLLPQLGGITGVSVPAGGDGPFRLEANNSPALPFRLVIPADSLAWTFTSAPIRDTLQSAYRDFLSAAEAAGVTPWGIQVLQQAISRAMPQTFVETLYYAYGLSLALQAPSGAGYADLRPGMVVRVGSANFLDPAVVPPPEHLAGFMPGGFADYDVSSLSTGPGTPWTASLDAFLGQLAANGIVAIEPPPGSGANEGGMADAADLLFPEFRQPFYRLFFPATLQSPSGPGSSLTAQNFAIAAARTYDLLQLTRNTPVPGSPVAYFRGRAVVRLCIRVFVNGVEQVVPIGTTVGNLLERYAAQLPSAALHIGGLTMKRSRGLVVADPQSAEAGASYPVRFDWKTLQLYGAAYDALSLPLLHGDQVTFGG
jgi:hypothetical protein